MRVVILEDETPAFNKLSKYLLLYNSSAEILAWHRSVEEALQEQEVFSKCNLVISDVKLLDGDSFGVFRQLEVNCPIIFCTAYNRYMQEAFETSGIAYLVKPYSQEAFDKAMQKYDRLFSEKLAAQLNNGSLSIIEEMLRNSAKGYKQRFSVKKRDGIVVKETSSIHLFQACGDFCTFVDVSGQKHSINYRISELEKLLDPKYFFRINRSEIVNIEAIEKVEPFIKNKLKIQLRKSEYSLTTSGARTPMFKQWLNED